MDNPRKARVLEQHFLNLPGFHAGAYVRAYVQDTSDAELRVADGLNLEFDLEDADDRLNAFHKITVLIDALLAFREGMAAEAALRRRRVRELERTAHDREGL